MCPREIEEVLINEKVFGGYRVPHNEWGEEIKACIVLEDGAECSEEDIVDFAKSKIAL